MFNALRSALACIIVMAIAPERALHNARQTGTHPTQIEHWLR